MVRVGEGTPDHERIEARPWTSAAPPRRILAIRIQALGDTVITLPYLNALRRRLPNVELDFVTRHDYAALVESVDLVHRVFVIRGMRGRSQMASALALLPRLAVRRYDAVIDLQRNRVSRTIRSLLRPRAWSEFDRFSATLAGERTRLTIEAVGLGQLDVVPDIALREPDAGWPKLEDAGWRPEQHLVVLNPGGLAAGRNWPVERFAAFAESFVATHSRPVRFVVLGVGRAEAKAAALSRALGDQMIDLTNRTSLREAMSIVRIASLVVSEDAGLLHMGWVLGTPTVGLFGASRWVWARPHGNYCRLVLACQLADGVCMDGSCRGGVRPCIEGLDQAAVERAALSALSFAEEKVIARDGGPAVHSEDLR